MYLTAPKLALLLPLCPLLKQQHLSPSATFQNDEIGWRDKLVRIEAALLVPQTYIK